MVGGTPRHVIGYMKDFLFAPEQARTPLGVLSGGERGRLMLAQALAKPSNLLVLDEPTNDLDLETLDVLEEMLGDYAGTVLLISHDRDFLDRVVSGVIVPEGDGRWLEYAGGYSDMLAQRGEDLARLPVAKAAAKEQAGAARGRRRDGAQAQAQLQREARAGDPAEDHRRLADQDPRPAAKARTIRISTRATAPASTPPRWRWPTRRPSWRRRKRNGWRWRSCARRSRAETFPAAPARIIMPLLFVLPHA